MQVYVFTLYMSMKGGTNEMDVVEVLVWYLEATFDSSKLRKVFENENDFAIFFTVHRHQEFPHDGGFFFLNLYGLIVCL